MSISKIFKIMYALDRHNRKHSLSCCGDYFLNFRKTVCDCPIKYTIKSEVLRGVFLNFSE